MSDEELGEQELREIGSAPLFSKEELLSSEKALAGGGCSLFVGFITDPAGNLSIYLEPSEDRMGHAMFFMEEREARFYMAQAAAHENLDFDHVKIMEVTPTRGIEILRKVQEAYSAPASPRGYVAKIKNENIMIMNVLWDGIIN